MITHLTTKSSILVYKGCGRAFGRVRRPHGRPADWRHGEHLMRRPVMSESNWAGQIGANNPNNSQADFKAAGMSDSQANEAADAAARERQRQEDERRRNNGG